MSHSVLVIMATRSESPQLGNAQQDGSTGMRRVASSSLLGCVLEWYDFYLYGFAAALVFNKVFFPSLSPVAGTLMALSTFTVGFIARPLGGVLCGHFGDRIGRKAMLILTIVVMGTATMLFGVLPTYDQVGIWAPICLVVLRFLQGLALGGEWGGAVLMVVEHADQRRRGFWGSVVQLGAPLGQALATGALLICSLSLSNEAFQSWGWRIPFLASGLLLVVALYIRLKVAESPEFEQVKASEDRVAMPIVETLKRHFKGVVLCFSLYMGAITVPFFINGVFMTSYGTSVLEINRNAVLSAVVLTHAVFFTAATLLGGALADRFGNRRIYMFGSVAILLAAFPTFWIVGGGSLGWLIVGMCLFGIPMWVCWGVTPAYFTQQFPANIRYSAISVSGQAATVVGGIVPPAATALVSWSGGPWPVAAIGTVGAAVALIALVTLGKDRHKTSSRS
ncbi:MFS transporter [Mycobacterium dioxanotrophicus]|uniref:Putative proline/betaine transporter n=1 Tax=Mycobacterium dioxanotrophicus TaxID=482462 RepID=A0A1Y0BWP4_9MYCO|nr:MFS transporter [Mycobacterium dioxanotrophicus]ART67331.1 MFS transporter [Mycobacterium dioxanotrophicus]